MNRISTLSLWLDALDTNFISYNSSNQVSLWIDKSSNAYQFIPLRGDLPPIWSTNALVFSPSSFHMISMTAVSTTITSDTFVVVSPTLLNGPRQPFFDNSDFTGAETDGRINTQVYADGREYFSQVNTHGPTMGSIIYKGDLYTTTYSNVNVTQSNTIPNYLQKYNPNNLTFEKVIAAPFQMSSMRALAVFSSMIAVAGDTSVAFYNSSNQTTFSTTTLSSSTFTPIVYNQNLYVTTQGSIYTSSNATTYPQLYQYRGNCNFAIVSSMQAYLNAGNTGFYQVTCNAVTYNGSIWFINYDNVNGGNITTFNGLNYNSNSYSNGYVYAASIYNGSLIFGRNDIRLWKWSDLNSVFLTTNRLTFGTPNGSAMVAYKGYLVPLKIGTSTSNTLDFLSNDSNQYITGNRGYTNINSNTSNCMIVHDGRLFFNANCNNYMYAYGNGTTLDSPVSTGKMLLMFRKSPTTAQLWINGSLAISQNVNFTYDKQISRKTCSIQTLCQYGYNIHG
jgi:hypothetical protein